MATISQNLSAALFFLFTLGACATPPVQTSRIPTGTGQLELNLTGFRNNQGEALVFIYPGPLGFPDDEAPDLIRIHQPIRDNQAYIDLEKLPYHAYAVAVLHDENLNGQMDKSFGGFSRNPVPRCGIPDYEESSFLFVTEQQQQTIVMQHPKMKKLRPENAGPAAERLK